jgi:hypothetical protein
VTNLSALVAVTRKRRCGVEICHPECSWLCHVALKSPSCVRMTALMFAESEYAEGSGISQDLVLSLMVVASIEGVCEALVLEASGKSDWLL